MSGRTGITDRALDKYVRLFPDCIPVKGASRCAICDLTRGEITSFSIEYYDALQLVMSDKLGKGLESFALDSDREKVTQFLEFLDSNELITFLDDVYIFPAIEQRWDFPATIQNAIIDVDTVRHDFGMIFRCLDELGCHFVQLRCFSNLLALDELEQTLELARDKSIESIELIIKHDPAVPDADLIGLFERHPMIVSLIVHSSKEDRAIEIDYDVRIELRSQMLKEIRFVSQVIDWSGTAVSSQ